MITETGTVVQLTDEFCKNHLDAEYARLCRELTGKLGRKRPSPLVRGDPWIWAGAVIYTVGAVNFLFDPSQKPSMTGDQLSDLTGVPKSTLCNKSGLIRRMLNIFPMDPRYWRRDRLAENPLAWMVKVDGFVMDARSLPLEVQKDLRRRGMIPDMAPEEATKE